MFTEDDLLPISALQHLAFCQRQCALIHIEGVWEENRLTTEGRHLHQRVDATDTEVRRDLRVARGLRIRSLRLGLTGRADVVEFHRLPDLDAARSPPATQQRLGIGLDGVPGCWQPMPVEYKRGRPKRNRCDEVQLCAQALCIEEMLDVHIPSGALFYAKPRRRSAVSFDSSLRELTETLAGRLHELVRAGTTPLARYEKKCDRCSLIATCMPKATSQRRSARAFLAGALADLAKEHARGQP